MPQFWVAIYHVNDFGASAEDDAMGRDIDALNHEMESAGVRFFAGGLQHPPSTAKSLRPQPSGQVLTTDGPYQNTPDHVGGFWILNCTNLDEALAWGRKASIACRAAVEVRAFY